MGHYPDEGEREIKVEIDPYDTWSLYHNLAYIIHPLLIQLKDNKQGAPFVDDEDVPEHLRSTAAAPKENEWDTDSLHFVRWDWVLDEMIWAFEPKRVPDEAYKEFVFDLIQRIFEREKSAGGTVTNEQQYALATFRDFLDGKVPYEAVMAARKAAWHEGMAQDASLRIMVAGALMMDSIGLVVKTLALVGHALEDSRWMADHLYDVKKAATKSVLGPNC